MKVDHLLSYIFLTITIITTYAYARTENHMNDVSVNRNDRLNRRSATVLIEGAELGEYAHGNIVYRKSQNRFVNRRRKPSSWKAQPTPKIPKKIRRYPKPPSYSSSRKSRTPKPAYRPNPKPWTSQPYKPYKKQTYKPPVKSTSKRPVKSYKPQPYKPRDPQPTFAEPPTRDQYTSTFGEPPLRTPATSVSTTHSNDNQFTKGQEFQPPPFYVNDMLRNKYRDTKYSVEDYAQYQYDVPEEPSASDIKQHKINIFNEKNPFNEEEILFGQEFRRPMDHFEENYMDNTAEFSKHHPVYSKPRPSPNAIVDEKPFTSPYIETKPYSIATINNIDEVTPYTPKEYTKPKPYANRPQLINLNKFNVRMKHNLLGSNDQPDHLLVGGQYAEPPARLIHKQIDNNYPVKQHMVPSFFRGFESAAFLTNHDGEGEFNIQSASMSPYVNYKNSNMAFSPQNLNDAFSIVD